MMKKHKGIALFGAVLMMASGTLAAQSNKMVDLSKLHPGRTTYNDLVAEYGKPHYQSIDNDGSRYSSWDYDPNAIPTAKKSRFGAFLGGVVQRAKNYAGNTAAGTIQEHTAPSTTGGSIVGGAAGEQANDAIQGNQVTEHKPGAASCGLYFDSQGHYLRGSCSGNI